MASWGISSAAAVRAQEKYDKEHTVKMSLKFNLKTDKDIITWLQQQKNKQGAIKQLIRQQIEKEQNGL